MSELRILSNTGDMKISWDSSNIEEVNTAKETFDKKTSQGWSAFKDKFGTRGEKIKTFDPTADRIVLVPPISGG